jgi:thioesterase domain-containing protein
MAVELAAAIAERLGIEVTAGDVIANPVLGDQAAALEHRSVTPTGRRRPLVELRTGRAPADVFLVPGVGGVLAAMQRIAHHLDVDATVHGFEAPGLYPGERPVPNVRWLARRYTREILTTAVGPYALIGSSFGGVLAHELARQLTEAGRPPSLLVIIDSLSPAVARRQPDGDGRRTPVQRVLDIADWLVLWRDRGDRQRAARERINRCGVWHGTALLLHRPQPIDVPVAIITSTQNRAKSDGDEALGWRPWLPEQLELIELEGEHEALIRENALVTVRALEPLLRDALDV